MTQTLTVQAGPDGSVTLPLGEAYANKLVQVTVQAVPPDISQEEWVRFIESTAGKWEGDLERPPQSECEERDPL